MTKIPSGATMKAMAEILLLFSLSSILFGILVILKPEIIGYLLGGFFIYLGILGLGLAYQLYRFLRR